MEQVHWIATRASRFEVFILKKMLSPFPMTRRCLKSSSTVFAIVKRISFDTALTVRGEAHISITQKKTENKNKSIRNTKVVPLITAGISFRAAQEACVKEGSSLPPPSLP